MKKYTLGFVALFVISSALANETSSQEQNSSNSSIAMYEKRIKNLEKSLKRLKRQFIAVKTHDAQDNIKLSADLRTSMDRIVYKSTMGKTYKNSSLFSNRLWINMGYAPSENMVFKGQLSYNKAYGASPKVGMGMNQRGSEHSYDVFDWVTNETLSDDTVKVKEAYWLYMNDTFFGMDMHWTASLGRRPSVGGFLISLRENDKPTSADGHVINMEFDGGSFKFGLEKLSGVEGMYLKFCIGRGLSNARARFNMDTLLDNDPVNDFYSLGDYSEDKTVLNNIDLAGFIFVPYDDGQYKILTTYYRAFNVPGFVMADPSMLDPSGQNSGMMAVYDTDNDRVPDTLGLNRSIELKNLGDMDGAAISILVDGIGDGISDFLDDTKFFASFAWSKTIPDNRYTTLNTSALMVQIEQSGGVEPMMQKITTLTPKQQQALLDDMVEKEGMLGSNDEQTGTSYWFGLQIPSLFADDGKIGIEYNHGSKYWRPFTYGEDTLIGSKVATRGDAYEIYYIKPLLKGFFAEVRYTKINYDYTGSQGFFGALGRPLSMDEAKELGMDPIEKAEDLRISFRYRF